jgi:tungstate transport system ATP-binding protein
VQQLLALYDIEKRYAERVALRLDYLELLEGRLYLLTGPNGSGKIRFNRHQVAGAEQAPPREIRQQVTLMHQQPYLIRGSVADNVAYGLRLRGIGGDELQRRVQETLALLQLEPFARRDARKLSGGEARRVALARAVACCPRLLLLDEPLANLDTANSSLMESVIAALPGRGVTVVMASHDTAQQQRLAACNIHLEAGRLVRPVQECPERTVWQWGGAGLCVDPLPSEL